MSDSRIIDQMDRYAPAYARTFNNEGKRIAFIAIHHNHEGHAGSGCGMGIAVENEKGFHPVPIYLFKAESHLKADVRADELNRKVLNLNEAAAARIVGTTMSI